MSLDSSVVICAHNEQEYIAECLKAVVAQSLQPSQVIVVLDRCSDNTESIASSLLKESKYLFIHKDRAVWKNSISENLELARVKASGEGFVVIDADMVIPADFLAKLLPELKEYAVVSAVAKTDPSRGILNWLVSSWERTYRFAPMGTQPRGGARVISTKDLNDVGGFRDVYAWETDLDTRLRASGRRLKLDTSVEVLHRRRMTIRHSISYQIQAGRARRDLGVSASRTLLHSLFRLRPFVIIGYFIGERKTAGTD